MRCNFAASLKRPRGERQKEFLQGLKPIILSGFTPGLKPRPPKEKNFPRRDAVRCAQGKNPALPGSNCDVGG